MGQAPPCIHASRGRHRCCHGTSGFSFLFDVVLRPTRQVPCRHLAWQGVQVAEHKHPAAFCALGLLDKLAGTHIAPESNPEGGLDIGLVMVTHHFPDVLRGLAGVVEGDGGDKVVADMGADDVVEEMRVNETQIAINGGRGAARECPSFVVVVRHAGVCVLKEGDGDCEWSMSASIFHQEREDSPIQLLTHSQGTNHSTITYQLPKTCPAHTSAAIMAATPTSLKRIRGSSFFL